MDNLYMEHFLIPGTEFPIVDNQMPMLLNIAGVLSTVSFLEEKLKYQHSM